MSVLTDSDIAGSKIIRGSRFVVNPASVDLTLGATLREPRRYWRNPLTRRVAWFLLKLAGATKHTGSAYWSDPKPFLEYTMWPGQIVLAHSEQYITVPDDCVAVLFSKSTIGRMGLEHLHAGYGDPGFEGQFTFELINTAPWPIKLVPSMRVMQIVFIKTASMPTNTYATTGHYNKQTGATPPRIALS